MLRGARYLVSRRRVAVSPWRKNRIRLFSESGGIDEAVKYTARAKLKNRKEDPDVVDHLEAKPLLDDVLPEDAAEFKPKWKLHPNIVYGVVGVFVAVVIAMDENEMYKKRNARRLSKAALRATKKTEDVGNALRATNIVPQRFDVHTKHQLLQSWGWVVSCGAFGIVGSALWVRRLSGIAGYKRCLHIVESPITNGLFMGFSVVSRAYFLGLCTMLCLYISRRFRDPDSIMENEAVDTTLANFGSDFLGLWTVSMKLAYSAGTLAALGLCLGHVRSWKVLVTNRLKPTSYHIQQMRSVKKAKQLFPHL